MSDSLSSDLAPGLHLIAVGLDLSLDTLCTHHTALKHLEMMCMLNRFARLLRLSPVLAGSQLLAALVCLNIYIPGNDSNLRELMVKSHLLYLTSIHFV